MKILNFKIPTDLQNNQFIQSLSAYYNDKGQLSPKQTLALKNCLNIEIDFFGWHIPIPEDMIHLSEELKLLKEKLKRNRFRYTATKNMCINAINSILESKPNKHLINEVLYPVRKSPWR